MARYTQASKDRVRDAVDFVELVSTRTDLRRAGPSAYEGLCPFHEERTPSFGIDPGSKVYYCFGCQASGDLFTFVQETEGVDFKGALELLADRCGIELEREQEDPREVEGRRRQERLLELLERTTAYYERYLWESPEARPAREYLEGRGLGEEALHQFRVGYAPSAWDRVLLASRRGGFSEQELYAAGLAQRSQDNGRLYDRFRGRIMFPLADVRGRVRGFGARAMREEQKPKYLNTSDNDVYHKGRHLYGEHLARAYATKANEVILCEGYTDVIALHQAGMRNAVGLMGTALTAEQVAALARMAHTALLALDADAAGQEAMLKASSLARKRETELRFVPLPDGRDPAELIQHDERDAVVAALEQAVLFERFQVERVLAGGEDSSPEGQDVILEKLKPIFRSIPQSAMRMDLIRMVSSRLARRDNLVEQQLTSEGGHRPRLGGDRSTAGRASGTPVRDRPANGAHRGGGGMSHGESTERAFLAQCIAEPGSGARALGELELSEHFTSDLLRRAAGHLRAHLSDPIAQLPEDDPELSGLLAELIVQAGRESPMPAMLESQRLQLELARIDREILRARGRESGDVSELAKRKAEIKRDFDRAQERALAETGG